MLTASVAELKNSLSAFLESVKNGTPVIVTDHRRPVAIIDRIAADRLPREFLELGARGIVRPAKGALDTAAFLARPSVATGGPTLSAAVMEDRDER